MGNYTYLRIRFNQLIINILLRIYKHVCTHIYIFRYFILLGAEEKKIIATKCHSEKYHFYFYRQKTLLKKIRYFDVFLYIHFKSTLQVLIITRNALRSIS